MVGITPMRMSGQGACERTVRLLSDSKHTHQQLFAFQAPGGVLPGHFLWNIGSEVHSKVEACTSQEEVPVLSGYSGAPLRF